jgi:hypothetical protein
MILDIIAIIFIVALSFILCSKDSGYNCQVSHIVIGLSVIVFYKISRVIGLNKTIKEGFDSSTSSLTDFMSGSIVGSSVLSPEQAQLLSPNDLKNYNDKLDAIISALDSLKNKDSQSQTSSSLSPANIQKLDLESQQQYQAFQIDYLNKQIQNAKDIIQAQEIANNSTNYKPIKVYSSCMISNADGTTSIDTPVNKQTNNNNIINPNTIINTANTSLVDQSIGVSSGNIAKPISNSSSNTSNFLDLSSSTGVFNEFFKNLGQRQGNININI